MDPHTLQGRFPDKTPLPSPLLMSRLYTLLPGTLNISLRQGLSPVINVQVVRYLI